MDYDLIVIGAGPGGYMAALRAATYGMKVTLVDDRPFPGGTCLHVGCIPSKALLDITHHYAQAQHTFKDMGIMIDQVRMNIDIMQAKKNAIVDDLSRGLGFLFRKNNIDWIRGRGVLKDHHHVQITPHEGEPFTRQATRIILAMGSRPIPIPDIPFDSEGIFSSTEILHLNRVPRHLVVVGGGYIGLELGSVYARLGSDVTIMETDQKLLPRMDQECATALEKSLIRQGLTFRYQRKVSSVQRMGESYRVHALTPQSGETPEILQSDAILVSVGRQPCSEELLGIERDERGFVRVNAFYETSQSNVYAIGDLIPGPMLAHKAMEEGIAVIDHFLGKHASVAYDRIPSVIYTSPEVASLGHTEEELIDQGIVYKKGKALFSSNGRAKAAGLSEGFVKILTNAETDSLLGVHIIGEGASTLIHEAAMVMALGGSSEDIARTCHAHPTYSEIMKEAASIGFSGHMH